ncbi:trypsin-like serine protease [Paraburkholderia lycopersici]|uniref:Trypsin n=1 Tax=Paraburkholderia lycopersici TaxID=416944 RepID=A0A1G6LUY2_9BURK|nr:trypsin-like serine protease [Paraburkholderia lycopersici]SDC47019.1 Trypsin [Paraburkholderia lycopersici]
MNNVLLVVSVALLFGATQARAEDIPCGPSLGTAEETVFVPDANAKLAATEPGAYEAGVALAAKGKHAGFHAAAVASAAADAFTTTYRAGTPVARPDTPSPAADSKPGVKWFKPKSSFIEGLQTFEDPSTQLATNQINDVSRQIANGTFDLRHVYAAVQKQAYEQSLVGGASVSAYSRFEEGGGQFGPSDAPIRHGGGVNSGAGVGVFAGEGGGHGGGFPGRPTGGPNSVTTAPADQGGVVASNIGVPSLAPGQKAYLQGVLAAAPDAQDCTQDVFFDTNDALGELGQAYGGENQNVVEQNTEWRKYLANPRAYGDSKKAALFDKATTATKSLLTKCYKPASSSPAYEQLEIPKRLGFIVLDDRRVCEALLLSSDHILTARHCWYSTTDDKPRAEYLKGTAYFEQSGNTAKRHQICAAETKLKGTSQSLQSMSEEQVVMRIAPVSEDVTALEVMGADEIKPFPTSSSPPPNTPLTSAVVFTWIDNAQALNPAFANDLAVGTVPCFVIAYDASQRCFTNMCMTYEGTSGGPVFAKNPSGKWKLLGVHLGAAKPDDAVYPVCTSNGTKRVNAGLMPNMSLLAKFTTKGNK